MSEPHYTAAQTSRAERAARRLGDKPVGMPVATLIMVICAVANLAVNCWRLRNENNGELAHEKIVDLCRTAEGRKEGIRRLARIVWNHHPMPWHEAKDIAEAMLDEYLDEHNRPEMLCVMRGE